MAKSRKEREGHALGRGDVRLHSAWAEVPSIQGELEDVPVEAPVRFCVGEGGTHDGRARIRHVVLAPFPVGEKHPARGCKGNEKAEDVEGARETGGILPSLTGLATGGAYLRITFDTALEGPTEPRLAGASRP